MSYEPALDKTYNKTCETSVDSDQPTHQHTLIRVFVYAVWTAKNQRRLQTAKSLFRLTESAGRSESSLGARVIKQADTNLISVRFCSVWSESMLFVNIFDFPTILYISCVKGKRAVITHWKGLGNSAYPHSLVRTYVVRSRYAPAIWNPHPYGAEE